MTQNFTETQVPLRLIGVCFILAAASSIAGLKLYDPILNTSDFLVSASQNYQQVILGAINELILVVTATGTGILLYPHLKQYNESLGIGYLSFRLLEAVFIMIGIVSILTVLSISEHYTNSTISDKSHAQNLGLVFIALHKWTFMLGPNFMLAINTFLYSFVFYKTGIIPLYLSWLGLASAFLIMIAAILELLGIIEQLSIWGVILALPIAAYELILAIRLIRKTDSLRSWIIN